MQLLNSKVNRATRANGNIGTNPNSTEMNANNSSSALMTNVIPYRSAAVPKM